MAIPVGSKAPDFSLKSKQASGLVDVKLSNNFGKKNTVLLFFPAAFTSVCTKELCYVRDNITLFNNIDAQVLGISVDSLYTLAKFKEEQGLNFPLLSDFNREVIRKYDVVHPEFAHGQKETAKRAVYAIDKDGTIKYVEVTPTPGDQVNFDALNEAVEGLN